MTATYTWDIFSTLDGFASHRGDWGGYWGKQGPELLAHRLDIYARPARMVFGANTYWMFRQFLDLDTEQDVHDPWVARMLELPATMISSHLVEALRWPDATVARGDAADIVARLKEESDVPLRSHGSMMLNRSLMAAGLVDRIQVTVFPVICGRTGAERIFEGADDFDLELLEHHTFDTHTEELTYHPTLHR